MIRSSWMRVRGLIHRLFRWWIGFRWIAVAIGVPLIGIGLSRHFWKDLCINQESLCTNVSNLCIVVGGVIVLPLILRAIKWNGFGWIAVAVVLSAIGIGLSWFFWEKLHDEKESLSTTIRNLSLVIGGAVAIELALWRSIVGERQTAVSQQLAETAQRDMLNQQFQKGAEMLGSDLLSVRLGGIYALRHLAVDHPEQFHVQCMEQLCAFIRGATGADGQSTAVIEKTLVTREEILALSPDREDAPIECTIKRFRARDDIQEALNAITFCHDGNLAIEAERNYWLNLNGADLRGADLSVKNLSRAPSSYEFSTTVYQQLAIGRYTNMRGTRLDDASLFATNLSRVDLSHATGLTQEELDLARDDPDYVPRLDGVIDAKTGETIVWKELSSNEK